MPRLARLDAPGALHHVICRGIERRPIVRDDTDRAAFIDGLGRVLTATGTPCYAWALLSKHVHLLLRTGAVPLTTVMRRLLTGYAGAFNRRHRRHGYLFQNRYKSILCQEKPYLLELVRYLHLNPLRVGLVKDLRALDRYPWSGHSALMPAGAGLSPADLLTPSKIPTRVRHRSLLCYWAMRELGLPGTALAAKLGLTQPAVSRAVLRGERLAKGGGIPFPKK